MAKLRVFISHEHGDAPLAEAWNQLIGRLAGDEIDVWYSSDRRLGGGMRFGAWRAQITERLTEADHILMLVTPSSNERPWIVWEAGAAQGHGKTIIPVYYFMREGDLHTIHQYQQAFYGEEAESVRRLCDLLLDRRVDPVPDERWHEASSDYLRTLEAERRDSIKRRLFHDHFHNHQSAWALVGRWHAIWSQVHDDGRETVFEADEIEVRCDSNDRIRMLGKDTKAGLERLNQDGQLDYYPMEGVISNEGTLALSYWNAGTGTFCGTALMRSYGGIRLEGHWRGFEAESVTGEPQYTNGRIVMMRSKELVEERWTKMAPECAPGTG